MAGALFWVSVLALGYTYAGYLIVLVLVDALTGLRSTARFLSGHIDRRARATAACPRISVLIAAHNEASCIREKIENTLAFDYPADKLEIIIGSDGSTDATEEIVRSYAARGVRLSSAPRAGKASVLNRLATLATGELWLFTDANTVIAPQALRSILRRFANPEVGGVCGRLRLVTPSGAPAGEGIYWKYENLLKYYESRCGALMGANGGLYVLRRTEWEPLPTDTIVDDFVSTMRVLLHGHRLIYEPSALAQEETASDLTGEARRHVRIAAGNFQSLKLLAPLLRRADFVGFAFWSHKVLRWTAPLFLLLALGSNMLLLGQGSLYTVTLLAQLLVLTAALAPAQLLPELVRPVANICRYFVEMNVAMARGFLRFASTSPSAIWERTERPQRRAA